MSDICLHSHAGDSGAMTTLSTLPHQHQGSPPVTAHERGSPPCPSPCDRVALALVNDLLLQLCAESTTLCANEQHFLFIIRVKSSRTIAAC